jgi:hypothetical protein
VQYPVSKLHPKARLDIWQQVELAAVVATVARAAERHHAVGVIAAPERARHQVGRVDRSAGADEAGLPKDLCPLFR